MSAGLDRLIQAEKNSIHDAIIVAIGAAQDAVTDGWTILNDDEKAALSELEVELRALRTRYRTILKGGHRA